MKKQLIIFSVALCILNSCNSPQSNRGEIAVSETDTVVTPLISNTTISAKQEYQNFKANADHNIEATNDSLNALKERLRYTNKKASSKIEKDIARLQQRNLELKIKLENYKGENWQKFKSDFITEMDSISANWRTITRKEE